MNKQPIWMLSIAAALLMLIAPVMGATLSRDMPSRVDPGSDFTVKLNIPDAVAGEGLTVEESLPKGVVLKTWDLTGTKESQLSLRGDSSKFRVKAGAYGWSVTPTGPVTITYTATAPSSEGSLNFDAVWFDKNGFNHNAYTLSVAPAPVPEATPAPAPTPPAPSAPVQKPVPEPAAPAPETGNAALWITVLVILIVVGGLYYYFSKKK